MLSEVDENYSEVISPFSCALLLWCMYVPPLHQVYSTVSTFFPRPHPLPQMVWSIGWLAEVGKASREAERVVDIRQLACGIALGPHEQSHRRQMAMKCIRKHRLSVTQTLHSCSGPSKRANQLLNCRRLSFIRIAPGASCISACLLVHSYPGKEISRSECYFS